MPTTKLLEIEIPSPNVIAQFGWMLGKPLRAVEDAVAYASPATDFWQEHVFDPGHGGETEILWVNYRDDDRQIGRLEKHHLTQQAVIPVMGEITQILALSAADGSPDLGTVRAFRLWPGVGICMRPGVWHATRSRDAQCLMLTRRSTTADLVQHLSGSAPPLESTIRDILPISLAPDKASQQAVPNG